MRHYLSTFYFMSNESGAADVSERTRKDKGEKVELTIGKRAGRFTSHNDFVIVRCYLVVSMSSQACQLSCRNWWIVCHDLSIIFVCFCFVTVFLFLEITASIFDFPCLARMTFFSNSYEAIFSENFPILVRFTMSKGFYLFLFCA